MAACNKFDVFSNFMMLTLINYKRHLQNFINTSRPLQMHLHIYKYLQTSINTSTYTSINMYLQSLDLYQYLQTSLNTSTHLKIHLNLYKIPLHLYKYLYTSINAYERLKKREKVKGKYDDIIDSNKTSNVLSHINIMWENYSEKQK